MMHSEMMSKLRASVQELSYAHIRRAFPARTSPIEYLPSVSEVVVEPLHSCTHPGVSVSVFTAERQHCFCHDYTFVRPLVKYYWRKVSYRQTTEHEKERLKTE